MAEPEIAVEWVDVKAAIVRLLGEHDMATAPLLGEQLLSLSQEAPAIILDLSDTEFTDSSVIHGLTQADRLLRERGQRVVVCRPRTPIAERVLRILKPDVPVVDRRDRSEALALAMDGSHGD